MKYFERLNNIQFLNIKLWRFSFRSILREYGREFIINVVLRHPIKTLKGIHKYRIFNSQDDPTDHLITPLKISEQWKGGEHSIVGVGFCLKPLNPVCVSGRANHNCFFFERHLHVMNRSTPECCSNCSIKHIGLLTLATGSSFYIMTSAKDILFDVLLPSIETDKYSNGLFVICRYSFEPFKFALSISGIESYLFPYEIGDCKDYKSWLSADVGIKDEQTELNGRDCSTIKEILTHSAMKNSIQCKFEKKGNIFYNQ